VTFHPLTEPCDYILLAGQRSPGVAEVIGADSPSRWDEQRGYGLSGARLRYRGAALSRPTVTLRLFTDAHFDEWKGWSELVLREPSPAASDTQRRARRVEAARTERDQLLTNIAVAPAVGQQPEVIDRLRTASARANEPIIPRSRRAEALDIWHPILELLGITSVVVENVLQPKQTADGEWSIEIKFIEHRPIAYALAAIEGSQPQREQQSRGERLVVEQNAANQVLRDRLAAS
jgi:hypothetical protein